MNPSAILRALQLALVGVLVACTGEATVSEREPLLVLSPASLDFGELVAGEEVGRARFTIDNAGRADLVVQLALEGEDAASFTIEGRADVTDPEGALRATIPPGESVGWTVEFAPDELRPYGASVEIASNQEDGPGRLPLVGVGREPRLPDIDVQTNCVNFGNVELGQTVTLFFPVDNVGEAPLELGSITQSGSGAFVFSDRSGNVIGPGDFEPIIVEYTPRIPDLGDSGGITIPSNDPDEPVVEVCLEGNGGGTYDHPVAEIDCPEEIAFSGPVTVDLDGRASFDPGGDDPLLYDWSVVRRPQAGDPDVAPVPADTPESSLRLDAAGLWEIRLIVTATSPWGPLPSVPAKCVVDALPTDDVYVELSWDGPTADFDLHLAQNGASFFSVPGDCSFCNPNPDWGVSGSPIDDPLLVADVDSGGGPEQIAIARPADGTYLVRVHHFDDGDDGRTTAHVQVFLSGQLAWSGDQVLERNEVWEVGQVNWPQETFGAFASTPFDAGGERECR